MAPYGPHELLEHVRSFFKSWDTRENQRKKFGGFFCIFLCSLFQVFEHSLELTQGDDLAKLLLLKSPSSEVWFDRRTNFTRSLAVMSMVGYVLGRSRFNFELLTPNVFIKNERNFLTNQNAFWLFIYNPFFVKTIGLGDRHPSNLLLDRMSGKILHIDFGDCFEVAMTREKVRTLLI